MTTTRFSIAIAACALLFAACAADTGSDVSSTPRAGVSERSEAPAEVRFSPEAPVAAPARGETVRPRSDLAAQVVELEPALYDPEEHEARTVVPRGLRIDALDIVGAPVIDVGVEPDGEMEIPGADQVGWYRFGSAPGEPGTSVLAAHIAYDGVDGVFRHLDALAPGATVIVEMSDGEARSYVIESVEQYDKQALPGDVWATDGDERLALITCGGDFNPSLRSYDSNVVAWAVPAPA